MGCELSDSIDFKSVCNKCSNKGTSKYSKPWYNVFNGCGKPIGYFSDNIGN